MTLLQGLDITDLVISLAILPAAEQNADPLEGEGSRGRMMPHSAIPLLLIELPCPVRFGDRVGGKLVERLAQEFGTCQAEMNGL